MAYAVVMRLLAFVGVNLFFVAINAVFAGTLYIAFRLAQIFDWDDLGVQVLGILALVASIAFAIWSVGFIERRIQNRGRAKA